jgi:hypothetical protein
MAAIALRKWINTIRQVIIDGKHRGGGVMRIDPAPSVIFIYMATSTENR